MILTRRHLLAGLGGIGALGVAGAAGLSLQPTVARAPRGALKTLDEGRFSVLAAVADVICPGGDGLPTAAEIGVAEKVDALLDMTDPGMAAEVVGLLDLLESPVVGLLLDGRPRPFTALAVAERAETLERWRTSDLPQRRTGYRAVHGLCSASYWSDPRCYAVTGYTGLRRGVPT